MNRPASIQASVHAVVDASSQQRTLERQASLAGIAAPTGKESRRAAAMQQALRRAGARDCHIDGHGNVCARIGEVNAPPLVCLAHLDTVYDDAAIGAASAVYVRRDGPILRAPGIGDNCRGLAAMLLLADVLHTPGMRARLRRPVHLVATVAEEGEGDLYGARAWFDDAARRCLAPFAAVAIDGPGDENIVHHAVGSHRMRVLLRGAGGHSWVYADAANPIHALGTFIARASLLGDARQRDAVVHVTRMHGGESLTAIPQQAWVDVDLRGTSARRLAELRHELLRLVDQVTPPALRAEITVLGDRPAGALADDHPLVRAAVEATEAAGGTPRSASASTDANVPLSRGIPAIALGAGGRGAGEHTRDEWYDDTTGARGLTRLLHLVDRLATA